MDSSQLPPGTDISMIPSLSPPPGVVPNFLDPDNLEGPILAVSITACVLAFALLSARLYSTTRLTKSFGLDDGAAVIALAFSVSYAGLIISTRDRARHGWDLPITKYTPSFFQNHLRRNCHWCCRVALLKAVYLVSILSFICAESAIPLLHLQRNSLDRTYLNCNDHRRIACIASTWSLAYKIVLTRSTDSLWNGFKVDILNIVESNVAIMVASMPACATFSRHFWPKGRGLFSSLRSRLVSSRGSSRITSNSGLPTSAPVTSTLETPELSMANDQSGYTKEQSFWKLKNPFIRGDSAPQITRVKRDSTNVLRTGDFSGEIEARKLSSVSSDQASVDEKEEQRAQARDIV
ncbi:MAG: hypothetical protein Q9190_002996 [Brigantiaea leucoxantha]